VEDALWVTGLAADSLELEITENVALNFEDSNTTLRKVQASGVRLAFDDFGTGYASLNHLTRFPIWRIKIDPSLVDRVSNSLGDAAIVRSLITMAHNLGLRVIAEGAEAGRLPAEGAMRGSATLSVRRAAAGRGIRGASARTPPRPALRRRARERPGSRPRHCGERAAQIAPRLKERGPGNRCSPERARVLSCPEDRKVASFRSRPAVS
jgi:hypothetical protein